MYSSLIGKIEKALRYAMEPHQVSIHQLLATFRRDHSEYDVAYVDGKWQCTCAFFEGYTTCSHTMALQRTLGMMVPEELPTRVPPGPAVHKKSCSGLQS
ncbi:MAG: hypothetical protein EXR55_04180 [Dehalococcoidia bacterium]|nr:hypothetical protein [Dehalococcoidia bacterium]